MCVCVCVCVCDSVCVCNIQHTHTHNVESSCIFVRTFPVLYDQFLCLRFPRRVVGAQRAVHFREAVSVEVLVVGIASVYSSHFFCVWLGFRMG